MGRHTWSKQFIEDFKRYYSRFGRDFMCYEHLKEDYKTQYPLLRSSQLTRLRLKRKKEFDQAREEHLLLVSKETNKRQRHQLVKTADLNARVVEKLIESQEEYLEQLGRLDREFLGNEDYEKEKMSLLRTITSLQRELNGFSGLDFQVGMNKFVQQLVYKKLVDEKDVEFVKNLIGNDSMDLGGFEREERTPKIKLIE